MIVELHAVCLPLLSADADGPLGPRIFGDIDR